MSRSAERIEQDWDHVASLAADLHDAHARLVDFVATVLVEGSWNPDVTCRGSVLAEIALRWRRPAA